MTCKAILVPFDGEAGGKAALGMALVLGERFDARIELLHVAIDPVTALAGLGEGIAGATASLMIESSQAAADVRAEGEVTVRIAADGVQELFPVIDCPGTAALFLAATTIGRSVA